MDPRRNPFAPGAGSRPPELAGREDVLETVAVALDRIRHGRHAQSMILLGLRGVGKTVLLNALRRVTRQQGNLALVVSNPTVLRLFEITRLDERFELHPDLTAALKAMN